MAKGSAMGLWRGRKGSTVFYYNKNSNNGQKQAMRERVYTIANPQSNSQVSQRLKLLPAQRVQQVLLPVLKRSWQGVEYGGKGLAQFMKYALKMQSGIPFVDKGDDRTIPGEYIVSKGTIPQVITTVNDIDVHDTNLFVPQGTTVSSSWGSVCEEFINTGACQEGDQITIVVCVTTANSTEEAATANYIWNTSSFIVDSTSTATLSDVSANLPFSLGSNSSVLSIYAAQRKNLAASAVIISRQAATPQRSTAQLTVNTNLLAYWFTETRRSNARKSYQRAGGSLNSNWPVEPDGEGGGSTAPSVDGTWTVTGLLGDMASANGQEILVKKNSETGELTAVYVINDEGVIGTPPYLCKTNSIALTYTKEMTEYGISPSDLAILADLPQIEVAPRP